MTLMLTSRSMPRKNRGYARAKMLQLLKNIDPQEQLDARGVDCDKPVVLEFYADDPMLSDYEVLETISASTRGGSVRLKLLVRLKSSIQESAARDLSSTDVLGRLPRNESMRRMHRYDERGSLFGHGPLVRFLTKQLGEPISSIKAAFDRRLPQRFAARERLRNTFERLVCETAFFGENDAVLDSSRTAGYNQLAAGRFYVHPEHGTLEQVKEQPEAEPAPSFEQVKIDSLSKLVKVDGLWYLVRFAKVTASEPSTYEESLQLPVDILLGHRAYIRKPWSHYHGKDCFEQEWGSKIYAVSKRSAGKKLLRRHGVRG